MINDFCGLTDAQLAEVRERHRHYVPVRVDSCTIVFIDPLRNVEDAKRKFIKDVKFWRKRHLKDER